MFVAMRHFPQAGLIMRLPLPALMLLMMATTPLPAAEVGEVEIRDVIPLTAPQRERLAALVKSDPEAEALYLSRWTAAAGYLAETPRPLEVIHYEGLVNTDPQQMRSVENLADMDRVATLLEVWQVAPSAALSTKMRTYILAWARKYRPTGNDVNENKLVPLFTAYLALRDDFPPAERAEVEPWLRKIGELNLAEVRQETGEKTNRFTKRLRILALLGLALGETSWLEAAWEGYRDFVRSSLDPDGSSLDFKRRDTLTYHCSALRPLLDLAVLASQSGTDLYDWTSETGASVKKSVDFVRPYAEGTKTHAEWVNTQAPLDRERAAAGIAAYQPGQLFEPKRALPMLNQAAYFDESLAPLVVKLSGAGAQRFPTWRSVLNEVVRGQIE